MQSAILRLSLLVLVVIGTSSCKKSQKLSELSDPPAEQEQTEPEMNEQQEEEETAMQLPERPKLTSEQQLNNYFDAIAGASSTAAANSSIREALTMFSSPEAPLLIVFYEANGQASYDEPTTIEKYLNYLKDTKNAKARVDEIITDSSGKIKEIVLKK